MKLSTSGLKMWFSRSGRIALACLLAFMFIPFMGGGKAAHANSPTSSTWPVVGQSVQPSNVQTLFKVGGTLYAGTGNFANDVWSNTNGTWTLMESSPAGVRTFLVDPDGTLYAGSWGEGVSTYTASDGWKQMSGSPGNVYSLIDVNGTIYAGASSGINNSKDVWTYDTTATTPAWTQMTTSHTPTDVQALIHVNGTLYAGTSSNGIWAYSNGTWTQMSSTSSGTNTLTNVVSLVDVNGTLYAATFGGTHTVWTYSGSTWTPISNSPRYARTLLKVGGTLYVGTGSTTDDMWTCTSTSCTQMLGSPGNIYAMLDDNGTLYTGTKNGNKDVWTYKNGAWSQMGVVPGRTNTLLSVNGTLYAGTDNDTNAVWAYTASGGWTRMSGSPGYVYALTDVGGKLYAGTSNDDDDYDVWMYDTTATTPAWTQMTSSLAPSNVYVLLNVGGTLYAGTNNGSNDIWTYNIAATSPEWTQMTEGSVPMNVNALVNVNGTLYAGTGGSGNDVWTYDMAATMPAWTRMTISHTPKNVHTLLNMNSKLYAGTANGEGDDVWIYDTTSATPEWTRVAGSNNAPSTVNSLVEVNGTLYAGTDNENNDVWSYSNGEWEQVSGSPSQLSSLLEANGKLYAAGLYGVYQLTSPEAPVNLQSSSTTATSTTLSWVVVSGAAGYHLYKDGGNTAIATVTDATYTVSGLAPSSSYTFAVSAFNMFGESAKSEAIPVQTLSTAATLTSTVGTVSTGGTANESITKVPYGTTVEELKAAITPAANATIEVYDADGTTVAEVLATGKKVIVTAQDGTTKVTYTVTLSYTVTYNGNGAISGNAPTDSGSYALGIAVPVNGNTGNLVKTGYTFAGWNTQEDGNGTFYPAGSTFSMGTTNVTLYAKWTENPPVIPTYTVTYNGNGATSGNAPTDSGSYALGIAVPVNGNTGNLVKTGYTFAGWNTQEDGNGTSYPAGSTFRMGTTNVTLYAKWTEIPPVIPTYTVTYNGNGATSGNAPTDSGSYAQSVTVSVYGNTGNLVKTGYTFAGWNTQANGNGALYTAGSTFSMAAANVTLYAKWTENPPVIPTYTVTYNGNGATSGNAPTDSGSYAQSVTVSVYGNTGNLEKTGYTFAGWNTQANGNGTSYTTGTTFSMAAANVTLYAKWTLNNTAPSSSGGSGGGSNIVTSTDGTLTLPIGKTGEVSLGDTVKISIPVGASVKELKITIEKVADTQKLLTSKDTLVSPVFEILKNFLENFSKEITMTFTFDPKGLKGNQKPSVFFYDEIKKVWVEVGGEVKGNSITVKVNHFTKYAVLATGQAEDSGTVTKPVNFSDIAGHWAEVSIKQAVSSGIVSGYPDGTFNPNRTVTRAEFAVMLMNTLKPQGNGAELTFADKGKIGTWAQKAVAQAVQAGIIAGYEDDTFRPDAEISRSEMAVMIAKALGQSVEAATATGFADDKDIPSWAKGAVGAMKKLSMIEGKGANAFAPVDKTTRAEAVTVLLKLLAQKAK